jgi:hypothetical protein
MVLIGTIWFVVPIVTISIVLSSLTLGARNSACGVTTFLCGLAALFGDSSVRLGDAWAPPSVLSVYAAGRPLHESTRRPTYFTLYFTNRWSYTIFNAPDAALRHVAEETSPISCSPPSAMGQLWSDAASTLSYMHHAVQFRVVMFTQFFVVIYGLFSLFMHARRYSRKHDYNPGDFISVCWNNFVFTLLNETSYAIFSTYLWIEFSLTCMPCNIIGNYHLWFAIFSRIPFTLKDELVYVLFLNDLRFGPTRPENLCAARVGILAGSSRY